MRVILRLGLLVELLKEREVEFENGVGIEMGEGVV